MGKELTPTLRFRGFEGNWQEQKIGDISTSYSGGTPSVGIKQYYGGEIPFIRSAEINSNTTELTLTEEGLCNSSAKIVKQGVVLYALYGATSGEVGRAKLNGAINQAILAITPNEGFDSDFLVQWLRKNKKNITDVYLQGGQGNLSGTIVKGLTLKIPLFKEQVPIGKFCKQIDDIIEQYRQHHARLLNFKKSMLQKMFPQNGSDVPEVRFAGFKDEWKQKKLGDFGTVAMNRRIFKEQTRPYGEIPFYKIGTFGDKPDAFISRNLYLKYRVLYPYPHTGDILISAAGTIGKTVEYLGNEEYFQDSNIVWLNHDERLDNAFLKHFYSVIKWDGLEGSTIKRLYNSNIINTKILVPSIEEQRKIGEFFNRLDRLVNSYEKNLTKLQTLKKSFLERMFV